VLCIFPFEQALLERQGIAATYVGHPLANVIPQTPDRAGARRALGLANDDTVVAVLPGSRASEIQYLAERFFKAVALLQAGDTRIQFVTPAMPALRGAVEAAARTAGVTRNLHILSGQSHLALAACDVSLVASGTATLEAALFKRPMVIAYHMSDLSWRITRRKKLQPWVGLPNILCGEFVVPELLQDAATPQALAAAVQDWLRAPEKVAAVQQRFAALHAELQRVTATLSAHAIQNILAG
jgi:lipid-A-disaccharide synthase